MRCVSLNEMRFPVSCIKQARKWNELKEIASASNLITKTVKVELAGGGEGRSAKHKRMKLADRPGEGATAVETDLAATWNFVESGWAADLVEETAAMADVSNDPALLRASSGSVHVLSSPVINPASHTVSEDGNCWNIPEVRLDDLLGFAKGPGPFSDLVGEPTPNDLAPDLSYMPEPAALDRALRVGVC